MIAVAVLVIVGAALAAAMIATVILIDRSDRSRYSAHERIMSEINEECDDTAHPHPAD